MTRGSQRDAVRRWVLGLAMAVFLAAPLVNCASPPSSDDPEALAAYEEANDPLEPFNRGVFEFNRYFDSFIIKPVAIAYRTFIPSFFRERVHTAIQTIASPVVFANDLLQGKPERAGTTLARALVNAVLGFGGMFDMASEMGIEYHSEDFGQTLAVWGADEGAYIMVPILGPTTLRDGGGMVVDIFLDPLTYLIDFEFSLSRALVEGVDERSRNIETIENLEKTSVDFYAAIRSLYRQHREDAIRDGELPPLPPIPGVSPGSSSSLGSDDEVPDATAPAAEPEPASDPAAETAVDGLTVSTND